LAEDRPHRRRSLRGPFWPATRRPRCPLRPRRVVSACLYHHTGGVACATPPCHTHHRGNNSPCPLTPNAVPPLPAGPLYSPSTAA
jgi:hypothetical protein